MNLPKIEHRKGQSTESVGFFPLPATRPPRGKMQDLTLCFCERSERPKARC